MKKFILLTSFILAANSVQAMPEYDTSSGMMPFRVLMQTLGEQEVEEDMQNRFKDPKEVKNLKQPAKLDLKQLQPEIPEDYVDPASLEMIQENGQVKIRSKH